jgi:alpha-glucosidase
LLEAVHQREMKLILDFVPNHTSDQHPWFLESRSSRDNPKRDWYLWHDAKVDGSVPNNWPSYFGGPAWEWDEATGQYYLHLFAKEQPDLNWRNPEVAVAMLDAMRFWLEKGVDGFRVDVIWMMIKDAAFRDDTPNPEWTPERPNMESTLHDRSIGQPEVHEIIRRMRAVIDDYGNRVLIGEIYEPFENLVAYYGRDLDECHLPFNFHLIDTPFTASAIQRCIERYEERLPQNAWPNWVLGNHDRERLASPDRVGGRRARLAQMLLLTLRGTPTMYYGDEIGMLPGDIAPEQYQDPAALNEPGVAHNRDRERTPMQWDASLNAGFSSGDPWLPVNADYAASCGANCGDAADCGARNVAAQRADSTSMLNFVKSLIALRQQSPALMHGSYMTLPVFTSDVLAYLRTEGQENILIAMNFSSKDKAVNLTSNSQSAQHVLLSTYNDRHDDVSVNPLKLRPYEGLMIKMTW